MSPRIHLLRRSLSARKLEGASSKIVAPLPVLSMAPRISWDKIFLKENASNLL